MHTSHVLLILSHFGENIVDSIALIWVVTPWFYRLDMRNVLLQLP